MNVPHAPRPTVLKALLQILQPLIWRFLRYAQKNEHNITGRVKTVPCKELSSSVFIISTQKVRGTMCHIKVLNLLYSLPSCILKIITFSVRTLLNYPFIYLPQLNLELFKVFPFFLSTSHFCNIYIKHLKYIKHIYFRLHIYYLLNIFTICLSQQNLISLREGSLLYSMM